MQTVASFVMFIDSMIFFITAYRKELNQSLEKKKANKEAANQLAKFKKQKNNQGFLDIKKTVSPKDLKERRD